MVPAGVVPKSFTSSQIGLKLTCYHAENSLAAWRQILTDPEGAAVTVATQVEVLVSHSSLYSVVKVSLLFSCITSILKDSGILQQSLSLVTISL